MSVTEVCCVYPDGLGGGDKHRRSLVPLPTSAIEDAAAVTFDDIVRRSDAFDSDRGLEAAWRGGLTRVEG